MLGNIKLQKDFIKNSVNNKIEKYKINTLFDIAYSIIFTLVAFFLLQTSFVSSLAAFLIALLLFPKSFEYLQRRIKMKINKDLKTAIIFILFLLMGYSASKSIGVNTIPQKPEEQIQNSNNTLYKVERVIDGDTIDVLVNNEPIRIRLIGIDAPETGRGNTKTECYADEAKAYLSYFLNNKTVRLEKDETQGDKDKYNRQLRYVYLDDINANLNMIERGYAKEYTYDKPYKYVEDFENAENIASNLKIGIWNPQICKS